MRAIGEKPLSLGAGGRLPPSVLPGRALALSTVPRGGRAVAYVFPRRFQRACTPN